MSETPDTKELVGRTFDEVAEAYESVGPEFFARFGRRLVELAGVSAGDRVLDVGCGTGAALLPAAEAVGAGGHVLGIDLAPGMVRRCAAAIAERGWSHVEARVGDAEDPPLPDADRDSVLAAHVLFFLPDPAAGLAAYRRILRPGGTLALSSWAREDRRWEGVYRALFDQIPEGKMPAMTPSGKAFESDDAITSLLESAGFQDVRHVTEDYELLFADAGEWLAWTQTHGAKAYWDAIPPDRLASARQAALDALAPIAGPDGRLTVTMGVRYTRASRP